MVAVGCVSLGVAAACLLATVIMMKWSFDAVANASSVPDPSKLANGINTAMIPAIAVAPLALIGVVFLILGLVRRQPLNSVE